MKLFHAICWLTLLFCASFAAPVLALPLVGDGVSVLDVHADIILRSNRSIDVVETIRVEVTADAHKPFLNRHFGTSYYEEHGREMAIHATNMEITVDGNAVFNSFIMRMARQQGALEYATKEISDLQRLLALRGAIDSTSEIKPNTPLAQYNQERDLEYYTIPLTPGRHQLTLSYNRPLPPSRSAYADQGKYHIGGYLVENNLSFTLATGDNIPLEQIRVTPMRDDNGPPLPIGPARGGKYHLTCPDLPLKKGEWFTVKLSWPYGIHAANGQEGFIAEREKILRLDTELVVDRDGVVSVTEQIQVAVLGEKITTGLTREIPVTFETRYGFNRSIDAEVVEVLRNGKPEPWQQLTGKDGAFKRFVIRSGSKEEPLPAGIHNYTFVYRLRHAVQSGDGLDSIFWSVLGRYNQFPVANARCRIVLPEAFSEDQIKVSASIGDPTWRDGEQEQAYDPRTATYSFATHRMLAHNDDFRVKLFWPAGTVISTEPLLSQLQRFKQDNPLLAFMAVCYSFYLAYIFFVLFKKRRTSRTLSGKPELSTFPLYRERYTLIGKVIGWLIVAAVIYTKLPDHLGRKYLYLLLMFVALTPFCARSFILSLAVVFKRGFLGREFRAMALQGFFGLLVLLGGVIMGITYRKYGYETSSIFITGLLNELAWVLFLFPVPGEEDAE